MQMPFIVTQGNSLRDLPSCYHIVIPSRRRPVAATPSVQGSMVVLTGVIPLESDSCLVVVRATLALLPAGPLAPRALPSFYRFVV